MMGTPIYLAPEIISGNTIDESVDIFSFGVCLYRMLNGCFPFESEHPTATMYLICNEEHIDFKEDVPAPFKDIIVRCLEKRPEDRPSGFAELATEIQVLHDQGFNSSGDNSSTGKAIVKAERGKNQRNPFLNRVMIKDPANFYGREREIRKIYSRLDAPHPQSISVVGERRIGKSSLLNYIYNRNNRSKWMGNNKDSIFVYLDFQSRTDFNITKFIEFLMSVFSYESPAGFLPSEGRNGLDFLQEMVSSLHQKGKRIILLMDEFERITKNPNFDESFFSFLRSLANSYRVAYVTSSGDELQNMCHNQDISDSPFFNIFSNLPLRPFTPEQAKQMIEEPSREVGVPLAPYTKEILNLSGYFPFFLQIACSCLFEALQEYPSARPDWPAITSSFLEDALPHYEFMWEQMDEPEKENLYRVAAGNKISRKYEFVNENLLRRGYLITYNDKPIVFARTFQNFVLEKQQKKASRRGLWGFLRKK